MKARNKIIQYTLTIWTLVIFFALCFSVEAATYYMRSDGTASNKEAATGCGSASTAMNESVHNGETFNPGDIINLCDDGGNYNAQVIPPSSGTSGNEIIYQKASGDTPTFSGISGADIYLSGKSHIVIDGLTFSGGDRRQIFIENGSNYVEIKNCSFTGNESDPMIQLGHGSDPSRGISYPYVHNNTFGPGDEATDEGTEWDSIWLAYVDHGRLIDNSFSEGGGHAFIIITRYSHHNVVRGNTGSVTDYWDGAGAPDKAGLDIFIAVQYGSTYNLFENNTFTVTGDVEARALPIQANSVSYNIFRKNIFNRPRGWMNFYSKGSNHEYNMC